MKYFLFILFSSLCLAFTSVSQQTVDHNTHAVAISDFETFEDLGFLKPILKDKRVVLLGESSHGISEFYSLKSRLVEYLNKELGFEVLAMESGFADVYMHWTKLDSLSAKELRNSTVFGNYKCEEIMPLFDYIKATGSSGELFFTGIDCQNHSSFASELKKIIASYDNQLALEINDGLYKYFDIMPHYYSGDTVTLDKNVSLIKEASESASNFFLDNRSKIQKDFLLNDFSFDLYLRAIKDFRKAVDIDWRTESPFATRDLLMADNLFWLMEELYPNKKFIVWAHNGHIDKKASDGEFNKWLGHYVKEKYGASSYALGLFARKGETYAWYQKQNVPLDNTSEKDIEQLLYVPEHAATYLNLENIPLSSPYQWVFEKVEGFELENGGKKTFTPVERFEGIIVVNEAKAPTYN